MRERNRAMEDTRYADEESFADRKALMSIDLMNQETGGSFSPVQVRAGNTMDQILQEYAGDIGLNPQGKVRFRNKRTGRESTDPGVSVGELGLADGDVLVLSDDCSVASDEEIVIDLCNKATGGTYRYAPVYADNTMGQVVQEYAPDLGLDLKRKVLFMNRRNGMSSADMDETVSGLGLVDGDVLEILDDAQVAGCG